MPQLRPSCYDARVLRVTFNPGPSQISEETKADLACAIAERVADISHRSSEFSEISRRTIEAIRTFFSVPQDYAVFFLSSATEAMQWTVMNLARERSAHFSCGSFSELFGSVSASLGRNATFFSVEWGTKNDYVVEMPPDTEMITLCANETSTGLMVSDADIAMVRARHPEPMLAVDITSIAGITPFSIPQADVWLFSVQKCLGLPAGLGVIFLSPRAVSRGLDLEKQGMRAGPFRISAMLEKMKKYQTVATPNVLAISLLGRTLARWNERGGIAPLHAEALDRLSLINAAIDRQPQLRHFIAEPIDRSLSVCCFAGNAAAVATLHGKAASEGMLLGKGYGKIRETTLRIANFPSIPRQEWMRICALLSAPL